MGDPFEVPDIQEEIAQVVESIEHRRDFAAIASVDHATKENIAVDIEEVRPQ